MITPDWPAPANVHAFSTTRQGGVSRGIYQNLNLGTHVGDEPQDVAQNRQRLQELLGDAQPCWLDQVHGTELLELTSGIQARSSADGSYSFHPNLACVVMTADCLPVLLCRLDGQGVSAIHAGWRGLCGGIIEKAAARLGPPRELMAWLGPAIGPECFEVGPEVVEAFCNKQPEAIDAFIQKGERWYGSLEKLAMQRLQHYGVEQIYKSGLCTYSDPERFYSYRRDGETGRMASLIWFD